MFTHVHPNTSSQRRFLRLIPLQMFHRRPQRGAFLALLRRARVERLHVRVATGGVRKVVDVHVVPFLEDPGRPWCHGMEVMEVVGGVKSKLYHI